MLLIELARSPGSLWRGIRMSQLRFFGCGVFRLFKVTLPIVLLPKFENSTYCQTLAMFKNVFFCRDVLWWSCELICPPLLSCVILYCPSFVPNSKINFDGRAGKEQARAELNWNHASLSTESGDNYFFADVGGGPIILSLDLVILYVKWVASRGYVHISSLVQTKQ